MSQRDVCVESDLAATLGSCPLFTSQVYLSSTSSWPSPSQPFQSIVRADSLTSITYVFYAFTQFWAQLIFLLTKWRHTHTLDELRKLVYHILRHEVLSPLLPEATYHKYQYTGNKQSGENPKMPSSLRNYIFLKIRNCIEKVTGLPKKMAHN